VSSARQRAALSALDAARPKASRLDPARNAEENAADIIDVWSAVETALRSLLGGSPLAGQALIHEARQRHLITFEQANQLAASLAVRDRVQRTDYTPNSTDVVTARDAYRALEDGLMAGPTPEAEPVAAVTNAAPVAQAPATTVRRPYRRIPLILVVAVVLVIAGLVAMWYFVWGPGSYSAYNRGVALYGNSSPVAARAQFQRAAEQHPNDARPHIYLGRIAREERDYATARRELETAIRLDPESALAYREMGSLMLVTGNYPLARNFYVRSIERNGSDPIALGYLGCALARMGRVAEALRFIERAGQGPWQQCAAAGMPPMPPPT